MYLGGTQSFLQWQLSIVSLLIVSGKVYSAVIS